MTRTRIGLALSAAVFGLSGLVGLTASGAFAAAPTPEPSATEEAPDGHGMSNILHGEGVIKTKDGTQPVAMQHGTVTAVSDSSITLKSSDGYTKTWSLAPTVHVVEHRTALQPAPVKIGTDLAVAGPREGTRNTATIIVVSPK
jgi:hypothetical protein